VLVMLVEAYERQHFPLDLPDPAGKSSGSVARQRLTAD